MNGSKMTTQPTGVAMDWGRESLFRRGFEQELPSFPDCLERAAG
jgi:hypothetical protein